MKRIFFGFAFLLALTSFSQPSQLSIEKVPDWVERVSNRSSEIGEGASFYHLLDRQDNVKDKHYFRHFTIEIITNQGVQEMSDLTVDFDPEYEKLIFHYVHIIRGGETLDLLKDHQFKVIQRETNLERHLYDGRLTAILNIRDVRVGDIIDYAYTIEGDNPIYDDHYFGAYYFQFGQPVGRVYNRHISDPEHKYIYKTYNDLPKPSIVRSGNQTQLIWDQKNVKAKYFDNNVPAWYDPYPFALLSDFATWEDVVNWALPKYSITESNFIRKKLDSFEGDTWDKIKAVIDFVQDEVRYLGFEQGLHSIKPHQPDEVLENRFGDCKDKSLLLTAFFREMELEAYPMLVHSYNGKTVGAKLPSPGHFDHCVVHLRFANRDYYIDPTISNQGGGIDEINFPNYEYGLILREGEKSLTRLPKPTRSKISVNETYEIDEIGEGARYHIETTYYGDKADYQRSYFASKSLESIQEGYLDYYGKLFYGIEVNKPIEFFDDIASFTVRESYYLKEPWQLLPDDSSTVYFEIYPIVLQDYVGITRSGERTMPFHLSFPSEYEQFTTIELPEKWNVELDKTVVESDAFHFSSSMKGTGKFVDVMYKYYTKKELLQPEEVKDFYDKHERINNKLSYYLTYNKSLANSTSSFTLNSEMTGLAIVTLVAAIFGVFYLNKKYDPVPKSNKTMDIGGWLILIIIGLIITPFRLLYDLYNSPEYFNGNYWDLIFAGSLGEGSFGLGLLMAIEMIYNISLIVFVIFLITQFIQKRSSLPMLMTVYFLGSLLFLILDTVVASILSLPIAQEDMNEIYGDIARSFIAAAIWIPYFNLSKRVKDTFVVQRRPEVILKGEEIKVATMA